MFKVLLFSNRTKVFKVRNRNEYRFELEIKLLRNRISLKPSLFSVLFIDDLFTILFLVKLLEVNWPRQCPQSNSQRNFSNVFYSDRMPSVVLSISTVDHKGTMPCNSTVYSSTVVLQNLSNITIYFSIILGLKFLKMHLVLLKP